MKFVCGILNTLSVLLLSACSSQVVSAHSTESSCSPLPLAEWVREATFAVYITPTEASSLAQSKDLCLPLGEASNMIGTPQRVCVAHKAFGFDVSNAWISELERIAFDQDLYFNQKITPTVFTEPEHGMSYCASLPKQKYGAIVMQTSNGSVLAAPVNKKTFDEIRRRVSVEIESEKAEKGQNSSLTR
jgi:hypothetical protein